MRYIIAIVLALFLLTGCAMSVSDVNAQKEKLVGKEITVKGTVGNVVKIGPISGYSLKDEKSNNGIAVSAKQLPAEGDSMTVSGVWMKDTLLGYYLKADN